MRSKIITKTHIPAAAAGCKAGLLALAVLLAGSTGARAQLINYNFDNLSTGDLVGQDGWTNPSTITYNDPNVADGTNVLDTTLNAVAAGSTYATSAAEKNFAASGNFGLTTADTLTLSFDFVATTSTSTALFGVGAIAAPSVFGTYSNDGFIIRGDNFGTIYQGVNSLGSLVSPTVGDLYSVESIWNLSTGTASLFYEDLTAGQSSYTELYFNYGGNPESATVPLGITVADAVTAWKYGYIRLGNSPGSGGEIDDLSVTSVPEPSVMSLWLMGGLLGVCGMQWKRRRSGLAEA